jgi:GNAT superfamily N-acetyltransferase
MPFPSLITAANALPLSQFRSTYLPSLPPFSTVNGTEYTIELHTALTLAPEDFLACFSLIRDTSAEMYSQSTVGWKPVAKKREMQDEAIRYLIVKMRPKNKCEDGDGEGGELIEGSSDAPPYSGHSGDEEIASKDCVVGFLSFMFTIEADYPVIYCYEIHLLPSMRGCGLGRHLMRLMEQIGRKVGLDKAMLTVFLRNEGGMKFYERIG